MGSIEFSDCPLISVLTFSVIFFCLIFFLLIFISGGGHYTAHVRNLDDGLWYDCNDSWCTLEDIDRIVSTEAYVLFYRRSMCFMIKFFFLI